MDVLILRIVNTVTADGLATSSAAAGLIAHLDEFSAMMRFPQS